MRIDSTLRAIDPTDCGCTGCLTGTYVPLSRATDDQIQAMFLGIISDHTGNQWTITHTDDHRFTVTTQAITSGYYDDDPVTRDYTYTIDKIAMPITVDTFILDADINYVADNLVHLRR